MHLILPFTAPEASAASVSGGKGANLAKPPMAALPVPRGFIITEAAYRRFAGGCRSAVGSGPFVSLDDDGEMDAALRRSSLRWRGFLFRTRWARPCALV